MRGGIRAGSGRKKKKSHLKRNLITICLPQWMILQLKKQGQLGYVIEYVLAKKAGLSSPEDYDINS